MKVACIMPTANKRPQMILEALESLKNQTVPVDELFILSDEERNTVWSRINKGVYLSIADAFFVLCDDDIIRPNFIEETKRVMEETNADLVSVALENFGTMTGVHQCGATPFMTTLTRRSIWEKAGGYDNNAGLPGDYDFYLTCLEKGAKWSKIAEPLFLFRTHDVKWSNEDDWASGFAYVKKKHQI